MTIDPTELEQTLNNSIEEQAFSGVISIRQKDHVLYARAAGYADRNLTNLESFNLENILYLSTQNWHATSP